MNVCYTEDADTEDILYGMDTYTYKQLTPEGTVEVDLDREFHKMNVLDDYDVELGDRADQTVHNICTL